MVLPCFLFSLFYFFVLWQMNFGPKGLVILNLPSPERRGTNSQHSVELNVGNFHHWLLRNTIFRPTSTELTEAEENIGNSNLSAVTKVIQHNRDANTDRDKCANITQHFAGTIYIVRYPITLRRNRCSQQSPWEERFLIAHVLSWSKTKAFLRIPFRS